MLQTFTHAIHHEYGTLENKSTVVGRPQLITEYWTTINSTDR
jgi:hypothetical protein